MNMIGTGNNGTSRSFQVVTTKPEVGRNPLPPLEEQQRIVAVLDEAFEGLAPRPRPRRSQPSKRAGVV
jgi:hypothetical protein